MKFLFSICLLLFLNPAGFAQLGPLIWQDEFDTGELDLTKWSYETGTGVNGDWGTGQLDRATDREENVSFQDSVLGQGGGFLVITTRQEWFIDRHFTSGRINTAGKAAWGPGHRIVARVLPRDVRHKGQGFAFWMMPDEVPDGYDWIMWPQGGEIDIMEYVGSIPYHNLGSVHYAWFWENNQWQEWNHGHQGVYYDFATQQVPEPAEPGQGGYPPAPGDPAAGSTAFHEYGINWYADRIEFFVDDHVYHIHYLNDGGGFQVDGQDQKAIQQMDGRRVGVSEYAHHFPEWYPYEHELFIILSGGVGGANHTYGGAIVPEAEFPCSVFIDWVRVYELNDVNVGVAEKEDSFSFNVFPNPTDSVLNFEFATSKPYGVQIIDASGKTMIAAEVDQSTTLDIAHLARGTYLVVVQQGKLEVSRKIIIE